MLSSSRCTVESRSLHSSSNELVPHMREEYFVRDLGIRGSDDESVFPYTDVRLVLILGLVHQGRHRMGSAG